MRFLRKHIPVLMLFFWISSFVFNTIKAQPNPYFKQKSGLFLLQSDSLFLDSLTLIPNSLQITYDGKNIMSDFLVKSAPTYIKVLNNQYQGKEISVSYKVFHFALDKKVFNKEFNETKIYGKQFTYTPNESKTNPNDNLFGYSQLNRSGSFSRGISIGNNQDMVVSSFADVQLSGYITPDVELIASLNDRNIPIQPEGTTANLQNFDKKLIQINARSGYSFQLGDIESRNNPSSYFLRYQKKSQGVNAFIPWSGEGIDTANSSIHFGLSRGKWNRYSFNGVEGNQGPYRILGAHNEIFIVIISGTERVYLNGALLERGEQSDYIIDYNTGELRFMPKKLITKYDRIVVEYQYADRNYQRFLFTNENTVKIKKWNLNLRYLNESDNKNVPLFNQNNDSDRIILRNAGDDISLYKKTSANLVGYSAQEIRYKKEIISNTDVYIYSISPDSAIYQVFFQFVGKGKGNYIQMSSVANGKVYQFIPPINNILQGDYEPISTLVPPQKTSMLTMGITNDSLLKAKNGFEFALSNYDKNTYSPKDNSDNQSYAFKVNRERRIELSNDTAKSKNIVLGFDYEFKKQGFNPIERYRSVEFTRIFDRKLSNPSESIINNQEQILNLSQTYSYNLKSIISHRFIYYQLDANNLSFYRDELSYHTTVKNWIFNSQIESVLGDKKSLNTQNLFLNGNARLAYKAPKFNPFISYQSERVNKTESLKRFFASEDDYAFQKIGGGIILFPKNPLELEYNRREDYRPDSLQRFKNDNSADEYSFNFIIKPESQNPWKIFAKYRSYKQNNNVVLPQLVNENSLVARTEGSFSLLKEAVLSNVFYEAITTQEAKRDFIFVQVAKGQGTHTWIDYNGNGIKEFAEFERAIYLDQAEYIKTIIPSNEFVPTIGLNYQQSIKFEPSKLFPEESKAQQWADNFQYNGNFRASNRSFTANNNESIKWDTLFLKTLNPFQTLLSSNGIAQNSSFRHTLFLLKNNTRLGGDINYTTNNNRNLLVSGYDELIRKEWQVRARYAPNYKLTFEPLYNYGEKQSTADYFIARNFQINFINPGINTIYQPTQKYRIVLNYNWQLATDTLLINEKMSKQDFGIELRHNQPKIGIISLKLNYIKIKYETEDNEINLSTPVAFEMLQTLLPGENYTWSVLWLNKLQNNMQINLSYEGRKTSTNLLIHIGRANITWFF